MFEVHFFPVAKCIGYQENPVEIKQHLIVHGKSTPFSNQYPPATMLVPEIYIL